ncbi:hypothetical protein [Actinopolymorpha rutila]|uniref:Lysylphosphatidylglycerol synthetase-like protein (DUF2156 family) n=1 Tax=Actinopolymorpha rutila TaxID=446787 RepID=A0A852ZKJ2_9ACTN|nr:hypothetical protein [Actinopolymorpha rutila]NYH92743.1 lysylphosphatidylglycerol synthetase-like protein (DUF2156 family) [Actinopolymorpha rutila]
MVDTYAEIIRGAVIVVVALGLAAASVVLVRGAGIATVLAVLLEFLVAAGLLRLSLAHTWAAILVAVATIVIRKIVVAGFSIPLSWRRRPRGSGRRVPGR